MVIADVLCQNMQKIAQDLKGKLKVGAVDCAKHELTCDKLEIEYVPLFYFLEGRSTIFYDGEANVTLIVNEALNQFRKREIRKNLNFIVENSIE